MKKDDDKEYTLLDMFLENPGQFLSGEEISRRLSISRTAVWKQINKLRGAGYDFEALPRMGYRMTDAPDHLKTEELTAGMKSEVFGREVHVLETTSSTQEEARTLAEQGAPEGTLVIAEEQTGGRGRMGRKFLSPRGKGIWMSLILRPEQPLHLTQQLTLLAGVAVCRAIQKATGIQTDIKWPNDLLYSGKKVSGILLESAAEDDVVRYCIAGIGINVNLKEKDFPEELKPIATSLKLAGGQTLNRTALIQEIMYEIEVLYKLYHEEGFQPIASLWEALSGTVQREVKIQSPRGVIIGTAMGLNPSGALLVKADGEVVPIYSGDVQFHTR